jgi:RNA polymerase-interacting CarD/CdnL/TRCF family regulator
VQNRFKPGDRVIYRQHGPTEFTDMPATFVRSQTTSGREMYVITLDSKPGRPRQVGVGSVRRA